MSSYNCERRLANGGVGDGRRDSLTDMFIKLIQFEH